MCILLLTPIYHSRLTQESNANALSLSLVHLVIVSWGFLAKSEVKQTRTRKAAPLTSPKITIETISHQLNVIFQGRGEWCGHVGPWGWRWFGPEQAEAALEAAVGGGGQQWDEQGLEGVHQQQQGGRDLG